MANWYLALRGSFTYYDLMGTELNRGIAAYQQVVGSKKSGAQNTTQTPHVEPAQPLVPAAKPPAKKENEAESFLRETLGAEKGAALYRMTPKSSCDSFEFLENFTSRQLNLFFRDESPAAVALVLSRLPSKLAAETLASTDPDRKAELVRRIAHMGESSTEVLERVAAALRDKASRFTASIYQDNDVEIDGIASITAILKSSGVDFGDKLIGEIAADDPGLSRSIKERLYTLEDVTAMPDRIMEEKLRVMPDNEILLLLKNPQESFRQKILTNLSEGRVERLNEEMQFFEPAAKIEVEAAARDFLAWFRITGPWA